MNTAKRTEIFRRWREANPHPESDLEFGSHFELLVSVILSAQATDKGVNAATAKLYPVANTPETILALGEEGLAKYIQTIGLWRAKAKNVIATCRLLVEKHGSRVPDNREELEALPGVGRKTANVVLNVAFGQHTIAVDTHNFRVANRTGIAPGKTVEAVERGLMKFVPKEFLLHAHHWLILHGRYTCKAPKPDCPNCNISDLCEYKHKTPDPLAEPAPKIPPKEKKKAPARKKAPAKKAVAKKTGPKKPAARKAVAKKPAARKRAA
jgi:endonuclease-3